MTMSAEDYLYDCQKNGVITDKKQLKNQLKNQTQCFIADDMSDEAVKSLLSALQENDSIESLQVWSQGFSKENYNLLLQALEQSHIKNFDFEGNFAEKKLNKSIIDIATKSKHSKGPLSDDHINKLHETANVIKQENENNLIKLAEVLPKTSIKNFNIKSHVEFNQAQKHLAKAVESNYFITNAIFNLENNRLLQDNLNESLKRNNLFISDIAKSIHTQLSKNPKAETLNKFFQQEFKETGYSRLEFSQKADKKIIVNSVNKLFGSNRYEKLLKDIFDPQNSSLENTKDISEILKKDMQAVEKLRKGIVEVNTPQNYTAANVHRNIDGINKNKNPTSKER